MKILIFVLMFGMIGVSFLFGSGGYVASIITGTSTSDTALKAFLPLAFATSLIVVVLLNIRRKQR